MGPTAEGQGGYDWKRGGENPLGSPDAAEELNARREANFQNLHGNARINKAQGDGVPTFSNPNPDVAPAVEPETGEQIETPEAA